MEKIRERTRDLPAAAVAVVALLMAVLTPAAAEATFPGANGPIAYEAATKIGFVDPATGATDEAVRSGFGPSLFPGSRRLAYIRVVGFEDPLHRNLMETSIYVKSLHPDHPRAPGRRITGQRAFSVRDLAVTPDGKRIVFVAAHPIGYHEPELDIWSISTHGTGLRRLTKNGVFDNDVDVSPDGRQIAYAEKVDGRAQVFLMDIDGSNQRRLTFDRRRDRAPHWSPDGRRIVYSSVPGKGGRSQDSEDVWSIAVAGGRPRHLADNAEDVVYSPDGHRIAFLRNYAIWLMKADGSHQRRLLGSELGSEITALDWGSREPSMGSNCPPDHRFTLPGSAVPRCQFDQGAHSFLFQPLEQVPQLPRRHRQHLGLAHIVLAPAGSCCPRRCPRAIFRDF